jgi:hypothetical protein
MPQPKGDPLEGIADMPPERLKRMLEPEEEDRAMQEALIRHLLDLHPATLTTDDLHREFTAVNWSSRDELNRAIRELKRAGLVSEEDKRLFPTRPAIRFIELL